MCITDELLNKNKTYAESFRLGDLPAPPARRLAIVTCMDARMDVEDMLGLQAGDAHILRNAGGVVTEDVLRSLIISQSLLGTREVMIINHTGCGMLTFQDEDLKARLKQAHGVEAVLPASFLPIRDLEEHLREQVEKVKSHPWVLKDISVRGFIYDVKTGKLNEIT